MAAPVASAGSQSLEPAWSGGAPRPARVEQLQTELAARPDDPELRVRLAKEIFRAGDALGPIQAVARMNPSAAGHTAGAV